MPACVAFLSSLGDAVVWRTRGLSCGAEGPGIDAVRADGLITDERRSA